MGSEPLLTLLFTSFFADLYHDLPASDVKVDEMLDRLEIDHHRPEMRAMIQVGDTRLFATPRIYAATACRITWCYDNRDTPTAITLCHGG